MLSQPTQYLTPLLSLWAGYPGHLPMSHPVKDITGVVPHSLYLVKGAVRGSRYHIQPCPITSPSITPRQGCRKGGGAGARLASSQGVGITFWIR